MPPADRANFRRKVLGTPGFVVAADEAGRRLTGGHGRPAQLFRAGEARELSPPLHRPPGTRTRRPDRALRPVTPG